MSDATVTLQTPIIRGLNAQPITEVSLRRPKAGELRGVKLLDLVQMETGALRQVLPRISTPTLNDADFDGLDPADLMAFAAEVAGFLVPRTPETASLT
ncbi:MAG: phage tail assembly protein [Sphingomonadaceae bacterium]|nr:phage tail assembly protein [Sphingomonadaceae bacterium]